MNELEKIYRDAPEIDSPAGLDHRVLRAAKGRAIANESEKKPQAAPLKPGWRIGAYAVSTICMFGIGLGVLLETGMIGSNDDPVAESSIVASAEQARSRVRQIQDKSNAVDEVPRGDVASLASTLTSTVTSPVTSTEQRTSVALADRSADSGDGLLDASRADSDFAGSAAVNSELMVADTMVADTDADGEAVASAASSAQVDTQVDTQADPEARIEYAQIESAQVESAQIESIGVRELAEPVMLQESDNSSAVASLSRQKSKPLTAGSERSIADSTTTSRSRREPGNKRATRIRSEDWLLMQNQNDYTVQLAPAGNKVTLFLIADNLSLFTDQLRVGSESWLLLHGKFTDQTSAELMLAEIIESVAELPQVKMLIDPKVISFGELRQRLK